MVGNASPPTGSVPERTIPVAAISHDKRASPAIVEESQDAIVACRDDAFKNFRLSQANEINLQHQIVAVLNRVVDHGTRVSRILVGSVPDLLEVRRSWQLGTSQKCTR